MRGKLWSSSHGDIPLISSNYVEILRYFAFLGVQRRSQLSSHQNVELSDTNFRPGKLWRDDRGQEIQAHGGGVLFHEGIYYWFGEYKAGETYIKQTRAYSPERVDVIGVSCYSSADLLHWFFEGIALEGSSHPDIPAANVLERPKVLLHRDSGKFVMWMHVDSSDYEWARAGVAIADRITGPYRFIRSFRPHNQESRDSTVFKDDDGKAYLAYASEDNHVMHIAELSADYTDVQPDYKRILVGLKREAPAIFKFGKYYLLMTSGCMGWEPNGIQIFYTEDIMGNWVSLGNPSAGGDSMDRAYSFFSQPAAVFEVQGKPGRYIYASDQWNSENLGSSRYAWLPMWIEETPINEFRKDIASWERVNGAISEAATKGVELPLRPGPLTVIIPWLIQWDLSILDRPLDPDMHDAFLREKRSSYIAPT